MTVVCTEVRDFVGVMTLNRPDKHNSLTVEMLVRMSEVWIDWAARSDVRVAIVTGAGTKAFCAGGDLGSAIPMLTGAYSADDEWEMRLKRNPQIRDIAMLRSFFPKPVIAAVNGICVAGGMEFMQGSDIRIAAANATFGLPEVKRGLIPAGGSLARLPRQIAFCSAMELILTGKRIDAQEAWRLGLVNEVVPGTQVLERARQVADAIIQNAPLAVGKIKEVVNCTTGLTLEEAFAVEDSAFSVIAATQDAREGPLAFIEKRPPVFRGC